MKCSSYWLLAGLLLLNGCVGHFPVNPPLSLNQNQLNDQRNPLTGYNRSDELLVVLAFSGGGMRASALSYGVLKLLASSSISLGGRQRALIDEIDMISAVSGGSFTAAYYGLKGYRIFDDYEQEFLQRDVESALLTRVFNPMRWAKLSNPYYDRSELAAEYYDEILFQGAVFSDFSSRPGPTILINSTDLTLGQGFGFNQEQFNWICSDLSDFPVSRAVTASSAVPGLFSAVTLYNYGGQCQQQLPAWLQKDRWKNLPELKSLGRKINAYNDSEKRRYIHLMDGGLADNLGLRAIMEKVVLDGGAKRSLEKETLKNTRKILVIVANAAASPSTAINQFKNPPTAFFSVDAATTVQINLYNEETVSRFQENVDRWKKEISLQRCGQSACDNGIDFYFVDVSLANLENTVERDFLQRIPTTLSLTNDEVRRLIAAAEVLLENSSEYQRFIQDNSRPDTSE